MAGTILVSPKLDNLTLGAETDLVRIGGLPAGSRVMIDGIWQTVDSSGALTVTPHKMSDFVVELPSNLAGSTLNLSATAINVDNATFFVKQAVSSVAAGADVIKLNMAQPITLVTDSGKTILVNPGDRLSDPDVINGRFQVRPAPGQDWLGMDNLKVSATGIDTDRFAFDLGAAVRSPSGSLAGFSQFGSDVDHMDISGLKAGQKVTFGNGLSLVANAQGVVSVDSSKIPADWTGKPVLSDKFFDRIIVEPANANGQTISFKLIDDRVWPLSDVVKTVGVTLSPETKNSAVYTLDTAQTVSHDSLSLSIPLQPEPDAALRAEAYGTDKLAMGILAELNHLAKWAYMGGAAVGPEGSDAVLDDRLAGTGWQRLQNVEDGNAFGFIAERVIDGNKELVLAFRGTTDIQDVLDYDMEKALVGKLFDTYYQKLASLTQFAIEHAAEYNNIYVTGHSLGGGAAQWALDDLVKAGISTDKLLGATIGSPGLGFDNLNIHNDLSAVLYQFEHRGYGTGDPVTLVPGHLGTQLDIETTDILRDFYTTVFNGWGSVAPNFLELHSGGFYGESMTRLVYGDDEVLESEAKLDVTTKATAGSDLLVGSDGTQDVLTGGDGHDIIKGGAGDLLAGGEGRDTFVYNEIGGRIEIEGQLGDQILLPFGVRPDQVVWQTDGDDLILRLTNGVDGEIVVKDWVDDEDARVSRVGFVQADEGGFFEQVFVDISGLQGEQGSLGELIATIDSQHEVIAGSSKADVLYGSDGVDRIYGHGGDDRIEGGANVDWLEGGKGNDQIKGGDGKDYLFGGSGNDVIDGGAGDDQLTGGSGADRFVIGYFGGDIIRDFNIGAGDQLDLSAFFKGLQGTVTREIVDDLFDFSVTNFGFGNSTTVSIDTTGQDGGMLGLQWQSVATLEGVKLDDSAILQMYDQGLLIFG